MEIPVNVLTSTFSQLKYATRKAGIAQLVEHNLAKVGVASSNLVSRSKDLKVAYGWVAEWLCGGLQSRLRRFDSGPSLQLIDLQR